MTNSLARIADTALAHPRWLALGIGAASATGFAPLSLWPVTLACFALLMLLVARAPSLRAAFVIGWLFGVGHFTIGNNWIATAFTYQAAMPAWLGWIAVVALALYLAIYPGLACLAANWVSKSPLPLAGGDGGGPVKAPSPTWLLILAFAGAWIITEWLRSWVFTGFVWNPLGVAAVNAGGFAQTSWLIGTYGLSGLVALVAGALLLWRTRAGMALLGSAAALALLLLLLSRPTPASGPRLTVVQPNIPQETKADPRFDRANFDKLARLSAPPADGAPRLLLWPEAAIPDFHEPGYPERYYRMFNLYSGSAADSRRRIASLLGPGDLIVTGTADLEIAGTRAIAARNSVTVLDPQARIRGSYDKAHLVPYGEYLPMRSLMRLLGLSRLVPGDLEFWPGPGPQTIDLAAISDDRFPKMGVQVCYEIIFSGQVIDRSNRPAFIFNPSNDAWFGAWGPPQHLAQARLRAIEEGIPVVRSTPTGISAVIDADGRITHHVPMHRAGRIDAALPAARAPGPFARAGNVIPVLCGLLLLVGAALLRRKKSLAVI